jgi:hypothetical protein
MREAEKRYAPLSVTVVISQSNPGGIHSHLRSAAKRRSKLV